jgi:diguanylate cyclase (GGDEF)-like protein
VAGAAAWGRERASERRRLRVAEQLIRYAELLNSAREPADVHAALLSHVVSMVGAYTAVLCVQDGAEATLRVVGGARCPAAARGMRVAWRPEFAQAEIAGAAEAHRANGGPLSELSPLFAQAGASTVVRLPAWDRAVLFLVERRADRVFEPGDWTLLHTLVRQAEVTMERVRLFEEVSALSLTDPLTGLGNRRHLEVVLKHGMALAQRGGLLSLVMLDLDRFKEINDREGHPAGDQALRMVADTLRAQLRGSDAAVRYGGDEFLLVLPGTPAAGAETTVARIRDCLACRISVSAGVAEYDPSLSSAEEFIAATDRALYRDKLRRRDG